MSDHKREESLKSYSRRPSTSQKQNISAVLASIGSGQQDESEPPRKKALCIESCPETASQSHSYELENAAIPHPFPTSPLPHVEMPMAVSSTSTQLNQSHRLAGFAQSFSFSNCTFNISFQQWFSHMLPYSKKLLFFPRWTPSWNEVILFTLCDRVRAANSSHFSCSPPLFLIIFENWNVSLQNVNSKINRLAGYVCQFNIFNFSLSLCYIPTRRHHGAIVTIVGVVSNIFLLVF